MAVVTSGNMGIIEPETIRQRIISHYNLVEQMTIHINRETDYNWNHLHPFFNENGYFEWRNKPRISVDSTIIKKRKHFPIFELEKSSLEFKAVENNLYFRQLMLTTRSGNLDELVNSIQELIDVLNQKYNNKSKTTAIIHCGFMVHQNYRINQVAGFRQNNTANDSTTKS